MGRCAIFTPVKMRYATCDNVIYSYILAIFVFIFSLIFIYLSNSYILGINLVLTLRYKNGLWLWFTIGLLGNGIKIGFCLFQYPVCRDFLFAFLAGFAVYKVRLPYLHKPGFPQFCLVPL